MYRRDIRGVQGVSGRLLVGLGGLVGLVLLAGCSEEEEARFVSAPEVNAGSNIEGELTSSSPVNLNDGSRYSAHWLCGDAKRYRYTLDAPFAAALTVFDDQGSWLGAAESGADGQPITLLSAGAAQHCNLLVINGNDVGAFGPYTLEAEPVGDDEALMAGRPLVGQLTDGQAEYAFNLDSPAYLNLALSGPEGLDMRLSGENVAQRAESCAPGELRLDAYLEAGEYQVRLGSSEAPNVAATNCTSRLLSTGGAYQLLAEQRDLDAGRRNGGPLRDGDRITGTLEAESPNVYTLQLDEPSEVALGVRSSAFDTVLRVTGDSTDISNDDSGSSTDSRIDTVLMAGEYRVEVSSYGDAGGDYDLEMSRSEFDGEFRNDGSIASGESVRGQLAGSGGNRYQFTVEETSEVNLSLDSQAFDPVLHLQGAGVELSNDDGGGDRNALINTMLEPGDYTLEVRSYSGNGIYTLSAEQSAFEGRLSDGGQVMPGETLYGELSSGGQLTYQLVIDAPRDVVLESTSSALDTVMRITGNGVEAQNDDAADLGFGSRISQHLAPGTYDVEVSAYGSGSGMVRLSIEG